MGLGGELNESPVKAGLFYESLFGDFVRWAPGFVPTCYIRKACTRILSLASVVVLLIRI